MPRGIPNKPKKMKVKKAVKKAYHRSNGNESYKTLNIPVPEKNMKQWKKEADRMKLTMREYCNRKLQTGTASTQVLSEGEVEMQEPKRLTTVSALTQICSTLSMLTPNQAKIVLAVLKEE